MKKWFKKAIIGLSAVGVCTIVPLAVVSCSSSTQQNNNSNNNLSNNDSNKNSNSANGNTSTEVSYVPYSKLTTTVTKEASFTASLTDWTQTWNALTNTQAKFQQVVTNDVNAYIDYMPSTYQTPKSAGFSQTAKYSNLLLSFNDNTFNLSYTITTTIKQLDSNSIAWTVTNNVSIQNASLSPYLISISNNKNILYGGEYISSATSFSTDIQLSSFNGNKNSALYQGYQYYQKMLAGNKTINNYSFNSSNKKLQISSMVDSNNKNNYQCFIDTWYHLSTENNGINYGNLKVANTNN